MDFSVFEVGNVHCFQPKGWIVCAAEYLVLVVENHEVQVSNPRRCGIHLMTVWCFVAQSFIITLSSCQYDLNTVLELRERCTCKIPNLQSSSIKQYWYFCLQSTKSIHKTKFPQVFVHSLSLTTEIKTHVRQINGLQYETHNILSANQTLFQNLMFFGWPKVTKESELYCFCLHDYRWLLKLIHANSICKKSR